MSLTNQSNCIFCAYFYVIISSSTRFKYEEFRDRVAFQNLHEIMAVAQVTYDIANPNSDDSSDNDSFYGFDDLDLDRTRDTENSDVNFDGLESEDDERNADEEDGQEIPPVNAPAWTSTLKDVQVPDYALSPGILFPLPDDPQELDFLSAFLGDDIIGWIVYQTNLYAQQKLTAPERLSKFKAVTVQEMKAFFGIVIFMGMVRAPSIKHCLILVDR